MRPDVALSLERSFNNLWADIIAYLPEIVAALLIVIIGWILGAIAKSIVERVFAFLRVNAALDAAGVDTLTERAGYKLKAGEFVGSLVKWFVIIVFIVAALEILRLNQVTMFFREVVLGYLPNVIVAVLILLGASVLANIAAVSVAAGARAAGFGMSELLASVARYSILVFGVLAALNQLQIAPELIQILFMGIVFAAALAFGLAFGLGGKEAAGRYINDITHHRGGM